MNISDSPGVTAATTAASQASATDSAPVLVLKKALDLQANNAAALLQALPQPTELATSGSLGRHVNAFA